LAIAKDKYAGLAGFKFGDKKMQQLLLLRHYEKDFPTWHGNAFSSQSNFDNETGVYCGTTIHPSKSTKINCYFDVWSFPKTRFFEKMPTVGSDELLQLEKRFSKNTIRFTVKNKHKEKYVKLDEAKIRDFERLLLRCDWWQRIAEVTLKTRAEFVSEYLSEEKIYGKGLLFYEQLKYDRNKIHIVAQITAFKTVLEPFKVKHYMYENNVAGVMQNSVFSGDGFASYLLVRYDLIDSIQLQAKISDCWQQKEKMRIFVQLVGKW